MLQPSDDPYLDLLKKALTAWLYDESAHLPVTERFRLGWSPSVLAWRWVHRFLTRRGYLIYQKRQFDPDVRAKGLDWPAFGYSMVGLRRLDQLQACVEDVLARGVPGDLIETGAWRGGASILMRAVLWRHGVTDRTVWAADSFEGMPKPVHAADQSDAIYDMSDNQYLAVSLEQVKANFARFGLLDEQVRFLKGWFKDTLPTAPIQKLAVLRADGDLYESTMDSLTHLYHRVSHGGYVIIDDYHSWPTCRKAVDEFRAARGIGSSLQEIDGSAVYWQVAS